MVKAMAGSNCPGSFTGKLPFVHLCDHVILSLVMTGLELSALGNQALVTHHIEMIPFAQVNIQWQ